MWWHLALGRFLQAGACAGAALTVLDWGRFGAADIRVGRIVSWAALTGLAAALVSLRRRRPAATTVANPDSRSRPSDD